MRKVVQKDAVITGEGKGFPYTVVADLADVGIICKTADKETVILHKDEVQTVVSYCMKPKEAPAEDAPTNEDKPTDKPAKAGK